MTVAVARERAGSPYFNEHRVFRCPECGGVFDVPVIALLCSCQPLPIDRSATWTPMERLTWSDGLNGEWATS